MVTVVAFGTVLVSCCLPLLTHRTLELQTTRCQAMPGTAQHAGSGKSESVCRRIQPAYSAVIDRQAHHGRGRHLSATLDGRIPFLSTATPEQRG